MNKHILESLKKERKEFSWLTAKRRPIKKGGFLNCNDYTADYTAEYARKSPNQHPNNNQENVQSINSIENTNHKEKGPQLVKKK